MCVKPFGRIHTMARPNKLFKETMSYNLTIEKKDYEELKNFSTKESETFNRIEGINNCLIECQIEVITLLGMFMVKSFCNIIKPY